MSQAPAAPGDGNPPGSNGHQSNGHAPELEWSDDAELPTNHGIFRVRAVRDQLGSEHLIVFKGDLANASGVPVRIHSECLTSEVMHSLRCDCRQQLETSLALFESEGVGVLIYLRQEGRGIGLFNKIEAYALQDAGLDTVEANAKLNLPIDSRSYRLAGIILRKLGVASVKLLTNNPLKIESLEGQGIRIAERIPIHIESNDFNHKYLATKKDKLNALH
jgi:3,4-dihydroxy 2-butanone 4-phosphate synthase/GTP cyclohydrolase II